LTTGKPAFRRGERQGELPAWLKPVEAGVNPKVRARRVGG
jgi:hypothetical protein